MAPVTVAITPYYEHDGVVIYHDDCRCILPALPAESVDFVLTDPPYLVNYRYVELNITIVMWTHT